MKPIVFVTVDGGPDENSRYSKTIDVAIHHFKVNNLDAYFVTTNAPGGSVFNIVERRLAPLSRSLCGDKWGNHLDNQGRTVNIDLEKRNFKNAGEALADSQSMISTATPFFPNSELSKENLIIMSEE